MFGKQPHKMHLVLVLLGSQPTQVFLSSVTSFYASLNVCMDANMYAPALVLIIVYFKLTITGFCTLQTL